jgi:superfamily II DNA or RNA helicase
MWLTLSNRGATVARATPEERQFLRNYLAFPDPRAHWRGVPKEDAVTRLYEELTASFPGGFVPSVRRAAAEAGIKVDLVDNRIPPIARDPNADLRWLRPYQREAVEAVARETRGIVAHVTASGKTECQIALVRMFPCHWLVMAPDLTLVNNVADRFLKRNREHGVDLGEPGRIGEGKWSEGEHLTCATYQSIRRGLDDGRSRALLARSGGLICDESHVVPAQTFLDATRACDAYYRVGFSSTPLSRTDLRSAYSVAALGPIIHRYTAQQAVADGVISAARVRMVTVQHPLPDGYTYDEVYRELVVNGAARNALLVDLARRATKPAILFVAHVEHGKVLTEALRAAGVRSELAWGALNAKRRERLLADLQRGAVEVVVSSAVLKQGVDVPGLRTVVMGAAMKSVIDVLQKLGRGSRIERDAGGAVLKDVFDLLDVYDVGQEWLEDHSKKRRAAYLAEGYQVTVEGARPRPAGGRVTWKAAP